MLQIVYQSQLAELIQVRPNGGNLYTKSWSGSLFTTKYESLYVLIVLEVLPNKDPDGLSHQNPGNVAESPVLPAQQ